ncbi:MAG: metal-dependent hydrolase [Alphaproteobacteria bacterium]|nr:metal-dependent hydrolase [Alphaproteobacteria bacterium]
MADLLTHAAVGLLLKRGQHAARQRTGAADRPLHLASFVAGNLLPDLLSRLPVAITSQLHSHGLKLPPVLLHGFGPLHVPAGMALASLALSLAFRREQRAAVFGNLFVGMLCHLALDLAQSHAGAGYLVAFPLSKTPWELGWIGTEATVPVAIPLLLLALWSWRGRLPRSSPPPESP